MGDMACHIMDASFWTLQLRYPTRVIPESTLLYSETAPKSSRITYEFGARGNLPPVTIVWRDGGLLPPRPENWPATEAWTNDDAGGQLWIGSKAMLNAGTYAENPRLVIPIRTKHSKQIPLRRNSREPVVCTPSGSRRSRAARNPVRTSPAMQARSPR